MCCKSKGKTDAAKLSYNKSKDLCKPVHAIRFKSFYSLAIHPSFVCPPEGHIDVVKTLLQLSNKPYENEVTLREQNQSKSASSQQQQQERK